MKKINYNYDIITELESITLLVVISYIYVNDITSAKQLPLILSIKILSILYAHLVEYGVCNPDFGGFGRHTAISCFYGFVSNGMITIKYIFSCVHHTDIKSINKHNNG